MRYEEMETQAKAIADRAWANREDLSEEVVQTGWQTTFHFQMFTLLSAEKQRLVDRAGGVTY